MAEEEKVIRIRQLVEKSTLEVSDYLVVENDIDTWKVKVGTFNKFIEDTVKEAVGNTKDDIIGDLNNKLTEVQILMNHVNEMAKDLAANVDSFMAAEALRVKNEKERQANESLRQTTSEEMAKAENLRSLAEVDRDNREKVRISDENERKAAEAQRKIDETQRKADENQRKVNETARGVAEGERSTAEADRKTSETDRKTSETDRKTNFDKMTTYFNSIQDAIESCGNEGISKTTTASAMVVKILEVSIPKSSNIKYEALLHIVESPTTASKEGSFIALETDIVKGANGSLSGSTSIVIPKRYKNIDIKQFAVTVINNIDQLVINVEYKASSANKTVKTGIVWDNILSYKHDTVSIYSLAVRDFTPKSAFTSTGSLLMKTDINESCPVGFVTFLNSISEEIAEIVENIKPIKSYPIGSIYMTTSNKNPKELLGGGTWLLLYGDAVQTKITVDGSDTYSPSIYTWERQS